MKTTLTTVLAILTLTLSGCFTHHDDADRSRGSLTQGGEGDHDRGHGNDADGHDEDNPGRGNGR